MDCAFKFAVDGGLRWSGGDRLKAHAGVVGGGLAVAYAARYIRTSDVDAHSDEYAGAHADAGDSHRPAG